MRGFVLALVITLTSVPTAATATDTASCEGKRSWQRRIVQTAVHGWFKGEPRPTHLLDLLQAEQGIIACSSGHHRPLRLHTATLPRGLAVDQLGAVLLANELEWSGLIQRPEEGLAGEWFTVQFPAPVRTTE